MKLMKRVIALFLCFLMLSSGSISAFAQNTVSDNDVVVAEETTAPTTMVEGCEECGSADAHVETCSFNTINVLNTEDQTETTSETAAPTTEPAGCSECGQSEGHVETCSLYEAPVDEVSEITSPQVGDKIWIKHGSNVYKTQSAENGWALWGNYEVEIVNIVTDETGVVAWYEFKFTSSGLGQALLSGYKYVHVDSTSVEEPTETEPTVENACNCGEDAPENIADHADNCPRKQYVKSLFENKTAEEIYTEWDNYDEALRTDLLNMLQKWDNAKYEELNKLVDSTTDGKKETTVGNTDIQVYGVPEDATLAVKNVSEDQYHSGLKNYIDQNSELLYVYDITLTNSDGSLWQPQSGQYATVTLDFNGMGLSNGNKIKVLHEHNGELKELGEYAVENGKLTFTTDGFSKFYFYITYNFGGHGFTMSGGSTVCLSEVLRELAISQSVSDVSSVHFSNPDVLKITKVGADWELESLAPFGSEETLTITFEDGAIIEIAVKDPVIYNYAVVTSITNVTKLATKNDKMDDVTNGDTTPEGKTYKTNSVVITNSELIKAAGTASSVDIIVYAEPGMAIGFEAGTVWPEDTSRWQSTDNEIWFWTWADSVNYAIIKESSVSAGKQVTFPITAVSGNTRVTVNVTICVVVDSSPTLLQDSLPDGYSIKNVPVTLYNYDGKAFNEYYNSKSGNYFAFSGYSKGVNSTENAGNRGWTTSGVQANGGGGVALMGIVEDTLVNGLPVMSQGQKVDVFSATPGNGKTVYSDVDFQFVYNDSTGYYTYNSALNHAQYNSSNNTIELYKQSLAPSDTPNGASHGNAGFYPFEDIDKAFTNTGYSSMSMDTWKNKLEKDAFELIPSQYSTDIVTTSSTNPASTADMHYGLQVASDFYLPKGKQLNDQDMVYEFTGDDDLWVFIDGKLVLDIGGGHTYVSGSFNLTTGEVWVEKYTQLAAADGGSYTTRVQGTDLKYTDSFLTGLQDDQMHTIQIFYLERHGGVSNCRMRFNLPLVPSDAVNVSKNLKNQDGKDLSVTPDVSYTFTLYTAADDDDTVDATDFNAYANAAYTVTGSGAPAGTQYTDADGRFTLKDGWIASFSGIPRFTEVYVVETPPNDDYIYTGSTVSVNKADATNYEFGKNTETKVMQLNTSINFDFVNYMQTQPLTVEKQVVNGTEGLINPQQKFDFTLDFTKPILETGVGAISATNKADESIALTNNKPFQLGHDESITIPRVPVNMTFTLKEANPDTKNNSFDAPKFTYTTCTTEAQPNAFDTAYAWTMVDGAENKIEVTNQQRFDLMITKTGIADSDHHNASGTEKEERQSTIYTVTGKIGDEVILEMDVTICGNESVTICKLPVGLYTVEENTDWSWRYTPNDGATKNVVIPENAKAFVTYENIRTKSFWLSGDSYCANWWGGNNGTKVEKREEHE